MKFKTRKALDRLLTAKEIKLLEQHNYNPFEYMILERNAEVKVFQVINESQNPISLRY